MRPRRKALEMDQESMAVLEQHGCWAKWPSFAGKTNPEDLDRSQCGSRPPVVAHLEGAWQNRRRFSSRRHRWPSGWPRLRLRHRNRLCNRQLREIAPRNRIEMCLHVFVRTSMRQSGPAQLRVTEVGRSCWDERTRSSYDRQANKERERIDGWGRSSGDCSEEVEDLQ